MLGDGDVLDFVDTALERLEQESRGVVVLLC